MRRGKLGDKKIINRVNVVVTCVGYRNEHSTSTEATKDCVDRCIFCHYGRGKHWLDDYCDCHCPVDLRPGEKLRVKKLFTVEKIRKYNRKKVGLS